jgi:hypothetical protein
MTGRQVKPAELLAVVRGGTNEEEWTISGTAVSCVSCGEIAEGSQQSYHFHLRRGGEGAMVRTYRDIAIDQMLGTVEEAMCQVINWWGDLPQPMKEAIEQFRTQLGMAVDSVEFVKRALDRHETDRGKGPA